MERRRGANRSFQEAGVIKLIEREGFALWLLIASTGTLVKRRICNA
jgi:hypothetical protein